VPGAQHDGRLGRAVLMPVVSMRSAQGFYRARAFKLAVVDLHDATFSLTEHARIYSYVYTQTTASLRTSRRDPVNE